MHALVGDEADADAAFWNQDAFKEDEEDKSYKFVEQEDIVDSDIDLSEDEEEETEVVEKETTKKSSKAYREPASIRALKRRMKMGGKNPSAAKRRRVSRPIVRGEKMTLRKSTQRHTETVAKKRVLAQKVSTKTTKQTEEPRLTQEEMLIHALVTEHQNKQSLKRVIEASLDQKKRRAPSTKSFGPTIRYHSRKTPRLHVMSFTDVAKVPAVINSTQCKYKKRPKTCVITGLPAKYRDPVTGFVYANLDAFREIRRRYHEGDKDDDDNDDDDNVSDLNASGIEISPLISQSRSSPDETKDVEIVMS